MRGVAKRYRFWRRAGKASGKPDAFHFRLQQFGPRVERIGDDVFRICEGELRGQEFSLSTQTRGKETLIDLLLGGQRIGQCAIQYVRRSRRVVVWNIMIAEQWRGKGLASVLIRYVLRTMLAQHGPCSFALREVRLIDPAGGVARFKNIGIGLIAHQLGFETELDLTGVLRMDNLESVELVSARTGLPPGFMFMLRSAPGTLAVLLVDRETGRPYAPEHSIHNSIITEATIQHWQDQRMMIVGDANYVLGRTGVQAMISRLAEDEAEARVFAQRIRPVE